MKRALVIGSAPCVADDVAAAPDWPVIAVNWAVIRHLGPIEFMASIHRALVYKSIIARRALGGDMDYTAYTKVPANRGIPVVLPPTRVVAERQTLGPGSSALFAVEIALRLGYERLILCGVPLEGNKTLQENGPEERIRFGKNFFETFRGKWLKHRDLLEPHVRSMSGWTREKFGPGEDWK